MCWELRISRDHLLKTAEGLPDSLLVRAQQTAERLMGIQRKIQETSTILPTDIDFVVPESVSHNVAGLREDVALTLRDVDLLTKELHELFKETPLSEAN
jgi:hypothetical protein